MKEIIMEYPKQPVSFIDTIIDIVADNRNLMRNEMLMKSRKKEIVVARQLAMALSKRFTEASLSVIGKKVGNKDHATVLHAVKTINDLRDTDKSFNGLYESLYSHIGNKLVDSHKNSLVCSVCGSLKVIVRGWISLNENKIVYRDDYKKADTYCQRCEKMVEVITNSDYIKLNELKISAELNKQAEKEEEKAIKDALKFQQREYLLQLKKLEKELGIS